MLVDGGVTSSPSSLKDVKPSEKPIDIQTRLINTPPHVLIRSISSLSQASIRPRPENEDENMGGTPSLRKGVLLQARDRLFSRWKERFFVLTRDYLACFRKGSTKYSEMGSFIFKVNLATVDYVGWEDRRGGPVLSVSLPREGKMLLRAKVGLDQWYRDLRETTAASRSRRNALKRGSSTTHLNQIGNVPSSSPLKYGDKFSLSDSTPEIVQLCEAVCRDSSATSNRNIPRNRLSLMNNVTEIGSEGESATPPSSVTSSHKFSSCTSSTSGSGGSSSLASSPSLQSGVWHRPASPARPTEPRTRFSLYEAPRNNSPAKDAKNRHSLCVEPRGLNSDLGKRLNFKGSRTSLCAPRNPILELLEPKEDSSEDVMRPPVPSRDGVDTSPSPPIRPRSQSIHNKNMFLSRSRTNIALFRNSTLFN